MILNDMNMDTPSTKLLFGILIILLAISAFFSASETALMSLNRYRLRHQAENRPTAKLLLTLLERPDRLLGILLIGNTVANSAIASIGTVIAIRLFNDVGVILATGMLTLCMLVFVEVAPKTLAAIRPDRIAYIAAYPLRTILWLLYPVVVLVNILSNAVLRLFGVRVTHAHPESISGEELRTIVNDTHSLLPHKHRSMFLGILDLEQVSVTEIMVPRNDIVGIDLTAPWEHIVTNLGHSPHTFLPVYREDIDNVIGILHIKEVLHLLTDSRLHMENFLASLRECYFVPNTTTLTDQLIQFQKNRRRIALVVNEYGDILGLVTLEDILEEIVGDFTGDKLGISRIAHEQEDGSYLVDGGAHLRDLNRALGIKLPLKEAKTISGLIIQYLETIPEMGTCMLISRYPIEVVATKDNMVKTARISPRLKKKGAK